MKRLTAVLVPGVAVVASAGVALAAWTIGSIGASGRGAARTLPAGPIPTATASGSVVTVSFPQIAVGGTDLGAHPDGGYTVRRYDAGGTPQTVAGACHTLVRGPAPTLSCVETGVANGTWRYRVSPVLAGWHGAESIPGSPVTIAVHANPPTVTVTSFTVATGLGNTKVTAVGTAWVAGGNVTVYVCRSTACTAANAVNTGDPRASVPVLAGVWTYTSPNLGAGSYYLAAEQTDTAGNTGTITTAGPVVR